MQKQYCEELIEKSWNSCIWRLYSELQIDFALFDCTKQNQIKCNSKFSPNFKCNSTPLTYKEVKTMNWNWGLLIQGPNTFRQIAHQATVHYRVIVKVAISYDSLKTQQLSVLLDMKVE